MIDLLKHFIRMKKMILSVAAVVALSLMGCQGSTSDSQYTIKGRELSQQLDQAVEKQDTAAALAAEKAIRDAEAEIIATNDTAAIADFRKAVVDSRQRHAPYLTAIKVKNGVSNEKAVEEVTKDVLNGDVSVRALAASMDSALKVNSNE